ncbi:PAS domain S-box-containing protein [Pullulanibacillus pueri]|uniref:Sigma-54-dependent Fis family transcriptional regulator n=1 Tax=Pullulanibacillus pueri TaxID=1437324 RepID=A0A8J2ZXY9_9BACL|nr:sigma 54-interacting transcriptional regulator [Pullulanibacillus pueri]MBM7682851.1 PAS domain S-box-containing protein [Pullulanibacillus pueri]GGH84287.1 sigma-54-dependent Fis family transcriptional regulator [Pullulanibacillus pueri]
MNDKHARSFLQAILNTDTDAITIVDDQCHVLFWNKAAEETYNIPASTIVGQPISAFFKEDHLMVSTVLKSEQPVTNMYHHPREDKHVFVNCSPIYDDQHQLVGAVSIEQDITHIVKLNEQLSTTSHQLNELKHKVYLQQLESPFSKIKGKSKAIQDVIQLASKAAKTPATVLILGESGTGKELCAQAIHETSPRHESAFVAVNCGAIPHALFESELFGYERGAFTGAMKEGKIGKIEGANGGTLFLDEIGELPLDMQVKLLRVLQDGELIRVGGTTSKKINVRVIAATNRHLEDMVRQGTFRSDLFYRLNVIQITMPPLRDRLEDIPELVQVFLNEFANQYQMTVPAFTPEALQALLYYQWPGNVRELRNAIERAVILSEEATIDEHEVMSFFRTTIDPEEHHPIILEKDSSLISEKMALEKRHIESALKKNKGNKSATARELGISRVSLYKKLKQYQLIITERL